MKGFAKVNITVVLSAIQNHLDILDKNDKIRNEAILKYYHKYYPKSNWWTRRVHRKSTPQEFFWAKCDSWFNTDYHLYEFLTKDEIKSLGIIGYGDKGKRNDLQSLIEVATDHTCLLDQNYCSYVEKYNKEK